MKMIAGVIAALMFSGCGSSEPSSVFNGTYSGRLGGSSCVTGEAVNVIVRHRVEADGDEDGNYVELVDADGNVYRGQVSLYVTEGQGFYGFSLGTAEESELVARSITYNFYTRPAGEPSVSLLFRQTLERAASDTGSAALVPSDSSTSQSSSSDSSSTSESESSSSSADDTGSEGNGTCEFQLTGQLRKEGPG